MCAVKPIIRKMRIILLGVTPIKYPDLPLAFGRSGYIGSSSGYANNIGNYGYGWPRTVSSSTNAYRLNFGISNMNPSSSDSRYIGFPPPLPLPR